MECSDCPSVPFQANLDPTKGQNQRMPNTISTLRQGSREALKKVAHAWPPPIPFVKATKDKKASKKSGEKGDDDEDDSKYRSFSIQVGESEDHTYSRKVAVFDSGTPEEWCELRVAAEEVINELGYQEQPKQQASVYRSVLEGKAADTFRLAFSKQLETRTKEDQGKTETSKAVLKETLNAVALQVFSQDGEDSARAQKRYLRNNLEIGDGDPQKFADQLEKINNYLKYFPVKDVHAAKKNNTPMEWDELVDILDYAKKTEWHIIMLSQGRKPHSFNSLEQAVECYKQLFNADKLLRAASEEELTCSPAMSNHGSRKRSMDLQMKTKPNAPSTSTAAKSTEESVGCWTKKEISVLFFLVACTSLTGKYFK